MLCCCGVERAEVRQLSLGTSSRPPPPPSHNYRQQQGQGQKTIDAIHYFNYANFGLRSGDLWGGAPFYASIQSGE